MTRPNPEALLDPGTSLDLPASKLLKISQCVETIGETVCPPGRVC
jgi:hypothetical protein